MLKPRVFISCGQRKNSEEHKIALELERRLSTDFEPYVAVEQQSLRALRENIFPKIRDAEYFLFIDFKRERLLDSNSLFLFPGMKSQNRGSLFSHQELAIASFLAKDVLAFQEEGLRIADGLLGHLQTNCIPFDSRAGLIDRVIQEINARWKKNWRNELSLIVNTPPYVDAIYSLPAGGHAGAANTGRYFHLRATNERLTTAYDCYAYLNSVENAVTGTRIDFGTAEFKWAGTALPNVRITPGGFRLLDAFWVKHTDPATAIFNCFADSTQFVPRVPSGTADWILKFAVVSRDLPAIEKSFVMHLDVNLSKVSLTLK